MARAGAFVARAGASPAPTIHRPDKLIRGIVGAYPCGRPRGGLPCAIPVRPSISPFTRTLAVALGVAAYHERYVNAYGVCLRPGTTLFQAKSRTTSINKLLSHHIHHSTTHINHLAYSLSGYEALNLLAC